MNKDRDIAKALKLCENCHCYEGNTYGCTVKECLFDFSDRDRLLLLEKMKEREDWLVFKIGNKLMYADDAINLILTKGALRDAAWEWLKERR